MADAVFNVAHGALLTLGLARGDWDLVARGLDDRAAPAAPRAPLPAVDGARPRGARDLGALGATISGAGPTVLVWSHYEQTGGVLEALRRGPRPTGSRAVRAPRATFEPVVRRQAPCGADLARAHGSRVGAGGGSRTVAVAPTASMDRDPVAADAGWRVPVAAGAQQP